MNSLLLSGLNPHSWGMCLSHPHLEVTTPLLASHKACAKPPDYSLGPCFIPITTMYVLHLTSALCLPQRPGQLVSHSSLSSNTISFSMLSPISPHSPQTNVAIPLQHAISHFLYLLLMTLCTDDDLPCNEVLCVQLSFLTG